MSRLSYQPTTTYAECLATAIQHWGPSWCEVMTIRLGYSGRFYCSMRTPTRTLPKTRN